MALNIIDAMIKNAKRRRSVNLAASVISLPLA